VFFRTAIRRFFADDRGNVAIICAFAFIPLLVIAGGATDIARHEAYRVQLQDGVDRAVLAAASLTQTRPIEDTVADYLKTLDFVDDVTLQFSHTTATNRRQVSVTATYEMATGFLPLVGINSITVGASATAVERRKNIEISLILDISGSMREGGTPNRLARMKPAAMGFIDAILTPSSSSYTSVSLVPYAGSVNPGAIVMDAMNVPRQHAYSSCIEFVAGDYAIGMVPFNQRTQVPHFTYNHQGVSYPGLEWSWCPLEATSITYLSNSATTLKDKINNLKMHDGTGTAIAMKWGMLLLEPGAQPMVAQGAANGYVPAQFANRPAAFTDTETLKIIVLMTDGNVSDQFRPKQYAYPRACNAPSTGNNGCATIAQSASDAVTRMYAVCDRAKTNGVTVFTIGFDLGSGGRTQMRNCASSASHYYDVSVTGIDIATAFQSIASAIQKIKLTQ
jgi:Flp pilus assembly protein TadG